MPSSTMYDNLWLKRVWIPLWVIQLVMLIIQLIASSFALWSLRRSKDTVQGELSEEGYTYSNEAVDIVWTATYAILGVDIAIDGLAILQNIAEIFLLARKKLNPVVAVVLNSISTVVWLVLLILSLVNVGNDAAALNFIWQIPLLATSLGKLIYASVILHRFRQARNRGTYAPASGTGLDPSSTADNPVSAPPNPFRDPSRNPSPALTPYGESGEYYGSGPNIEMQQHQQQQQRYA